MKKFTLLSASALLVLSACAVEETQLPGVSPSPVLTISNSSGSFVGNKVNEFTDEYNRIHRNINRNAQNLAKINQQIAEADSEYNAVINTIEAKLQTGTTPSNPDLTAALAKAQKNLGTLENGTMQLATISSNVIAEQEKLTALSSTVNATYAIPGAYDVDHADLNIITAALQQQENTNADLIAEIKSDIMRQQDKAEAFRAEITRLNVDIAAGYVNTSPTAFAPNPRPNDALMEVKTLKPVSVKHAPAKSKSIRTNKKKVKLAKKFAVIEDVPAEPEKKSAAKPAPKKQPKAAAVKTTKVEPRTIEKAKSKDTPKVAKAAAPKIPGTIFTAEFPNDDVEYYNKLESAVTIALKNNPDSRFEVVAFMPMDTMEQERIQNMAARIFGDMLTMSVPAENLSVSAQSNIGLKIPSITIVKK